MVDVNEEFLRQLALHPGAATPERPTTALTIEDWARGANPMRLPKSMADPRATAKKDTESRGVKERALQNKGKEPDVNEQLLLQLGLHPAAKKKPEITPREMFGGTAPALPPPVSEQQRRKAERERALEYKPPPRSSEERLQHAAIQQGIPAEIFRRPLTDFEVRLRTQEKVPLIHPERGIPTEPFLSNTLFPLADPETGKTIGYVKYGADSLICDLEGNIVQWADTPIMPSAVQPDDLVLVGGTLIKGGGKLLASGGAALVRSTVVRRVSNRIVTRLRSVAAAAMLGSSRAAPLIGGELGARAAIAAERRAVTAAVEEAGTQTLERAGRPATAEVVAEPGSRAATTSLRPVTGATEVRVSQAQYDAALRQVFPSQYLNPITRTVDSIGQRAARRVVADPRFIQAIQQRNWTLAGTLYHSAAATEARGLSAALPPGWTLEAERTLQSGLGGSRADILIRGPAGEIVEYDWKTKAISALSTSSRREMARHAGHIATNVTGTLTVQESRTWIDFVREVRPDLFQ